MEWNTQEAGPLCPTSLNMMKCGLAHHWTHEVRREKSKSHSSISRRENREMFLVYSEMKIAAHLKWGGDAPFQARKETKEPLFIDECEMSDQSAEWDMNAP